MEDGGKSYLEIFKYLDNDKTTEQHVKSMLEQSKSLETIWNKANMSLNNFMENYVSIGNNNNPLTKILREFNHRSVPVAASSNKYSQGFAFFTRPQLALYKENLLRDPVFANLLNTNPYSVHRFIRATLDPRLVYSGTGKTLASEFLESGTKDYVKEDGKTKFSYATMEDEDLRCPLINNKQLFSPLLTNALETLSGWPDEQLPYYTGKPNVRNASFICADGVTDYYGEYDLSCTFTNTQDMPLLLLMYYWIRYCSNVVRGSMLPYPDLLYGNELDYTTRIYRLVMDQSKTYVTMISACGAAFPTATDIGKFFNFDNKKPYGDLNRTISINFHCVGALYFSPRLVDEFNKSVCIGCPELLHLRLKYLDSSYNPTEEDFKMVKIPYNLLEYFNFSGFPFINYNTMELEWWIFKEDPKYVAIKDLIARGLDKKGEDIKLTNDKAHIYKEESKNQDKAIYTNIKNLTIV